MLNVQEDRKADIVAVGGVQVPVMGEENEREITREKVKRVLNEMKGGKAPAGLYRGGGRGGSNDPPPPPPKKKKKKNFWKSIFSVTILFIGRLLTK